MDSKMVKLNSLTPGELENVPIFIYFFKWSVPLIMCVKVSQICGSCMCVAHAALLILPNDPLI